jgi:hypothetical protein
MVKRRKPLEKERWNREVVRDEWKTEAEEEEVADPLICSPIRALTSSE